MNGLKLAIFMWDEHSEIVFVDSVDIEMTLYGDCHFHDSTDHMSLLLV